METLSTEPVWLQPTSRNRKARQWAAASWITLLCFTAVAAGLQVAAGAYRVELASDPDEPAHAITGIAVEQYIRSGLPHSPEAFLLDYYRHYPKVAIGHWPPLLYLTEASAMLVASPSRTILLLLQALFAGLIAWLVFRELKTVAGFFPALAGALSLLCGRTIQSYSSRTMADILLTLVMFLACLAFARYAESGRLRDAMAFALWMCAAVLTKGTGWALLGIPVAVMASTRNWRMLQQWALWIAMAVVVAVCVPWQIGTMSMVSMAWQGSVGLPYSGPAAIVFTEWMFTVPGIAITLAGLVGIYSTLFLNHGFGRTRVFWASLTGLICASWLIHVATPTGRDPRFLAIAVPPMYVLAAGGARQLAGWFFTPPRQNRATGMVFSFLALASIALSLPVLPKTTVNFMPVAEALHAIMPPQTAVLVISDSLGEGALVSEMALREPHPRVYVVRGSKLLASQDWNGRDYQSLVHSGDDCAQVLESVPISFLVVDRQTGVRRKDFFNSVESMLQRHDSDWTPVNGFPVPGDSSHAIALYRRASGTEPLRALPDWALPRRDPASH